MSGKMQRLVTNPPAIPTRYEHRFSNQALRHGTLTNPQDASHRWLHYKVFAVSWQAFFPMSNPAQQEVEHE